MGWGGLSTPGELGDDQGELTMKPVEKVLGKLRERRCEPKRSGESYMAKCPAHDDQSPSLSVSEGTDGRALVYCFGGCKTEQVVSALGLEIGELFPEQDKASAQERTGITVAELARDKGLPEGALREYGLCDLRGGRVSVTYYGTDGVPATRHRRLFSPVR